MISTALIFLLGTYWIAAGLAMCFRPAAINRIMDQLLENDALMFIAGVAMIFGAGAFLFAHHDFSSFKAGFATVIGGIALTEGLFLIIWPQPLFATAGLFFRTPGTIRVWGIIVLVLGAIAIGFASL